MIYRITRLRFYSFLAIFGLASVSSAFATRNLVSDQAILSNVLRDGIYSNARPRVERNQFQSPFADLGIGYPLGPPQTRPKKIKRRNPDAPHEGYYYVVDSHSSTPFKLVHIDIKGSATIKQVYNDFRQKGSELHVKDSDGNTETFFQENHSLGRITGIKSVTVVFVSSTKTYSEGISELGEEEALKVTLALAKADRKSRLGSTPRARELKQKIRAEKRRSRYSDSDCESTESGSAVSQSVELSEGSEVSDARSESSYSYSD